MRTTGLVVHFVRSGDCSGDCIVGVVGGVCDHVTVDMAMVFCIDLEASVGMETGVLELGGLTSWREGQNAETAD